MYPKNFFSLFPPFPRNNKIFVAMSFDKKFDSRWEQVIKPTLRNVKINDVSLIPYRVDVSRISDSILTDILEGICNSRLILGDITAIGDIGGKPVCNGNVMYEIGIAQAIRLPEEVVLFSSDEYNKDKEDKKIPFDLSHIRVNSYDPDGDTGKASKVLEEVLNECLSKIDQNKSLAVKYAAERLDYDCLLLLSRAGASSSSLPYKTVNRPVIRNFRNEMKNTRELMAISRLVELGLLTVELNLVLTEVDLEGPLDDIYKYIITPFGEAVAEYIAKQFIPLLHSGLI